MIHDFEDFLMDKCFAENPCILDDDQPDFFNDWLCELEPDQWIEYGEKYKQESIKLMKNNKEN